MPGKEPPPGDIHPVNFVLGQGGGGLPLQLGQVQGRVQGGVVRPLHGPADLHRPLKVALLGFQIFQVPRQQVSQGDGPGFGDP